MLSERTQYDPPPVIAKYQIKALPTMYGGINYRSRIEARWAVFFDSLGLQHEYEREGYDLGDGKLYLPDFWLPELKYWVEIKGDDPDEDACDKAHRLAVASGFMTFVFFGGHVIPSNNQSPCSAYAFYPDGGGDSSYMWCECSECGRLGIQFDGRADRLPCKECYQCWDARNLDSNYIRKHFGVTHYDAGQEHIKTCTKPKGCKRTGGNGDKGYNVNSSRLVKAYAAARAIRFTR